MLNVINIYCLTNLPKGAVTENNNRINPTDRNISILYINDYNILNLMNL